MDKQHLLELIARYRDGNSTPSETELLEAWYLHQADQHRQTIDPEEIRHRLARIEARLPTHATQRAQPIRWIRRLAGVAVVVMMLGLSWFLYRTHQELTSESILPGGNKAYLTWSDGRAIALQQDKGGIILQAGQIVYEDGLQVTDAQRTLGEIPSEVFTLNTPRGGQYQITLEDGTRIWLNASSKLHYPAQFSGKQRVVELEGEAYFEVARLQDQPFIVRTDRQDIHVLGTHFNVHAYRDEHQNRTTLLEGSVKVAGKGINGDSPESQTVVLIPGEEVVVSSGQMTKQMVDVESTLAWKNGYISFNERPLKEILGDIARWYDVEIVYENVDQDARYGGKVSRYADVASVLKRLELTGTVHFEIKGRRIIVRK